MAVWWTPTLMWCPQELSGRGGAAVWRASGNTLCFCAERLQIRGYTAKGLGQLWRVREVAALSVLRVLDALCGGGGGDAVLLETTQALHVALQRSAAYEPMPQVRALLQHGGALAEELNACADPTAVLHRRRTRRGTARGRRRKRRCRARWSRSCGSWRRCAWTPSASRRWCRSSSSWRRVARCTRS
jgi:hypothetical protein